MIFLFYKSKMVHMNGLTIFILSFFKIVFTKDTVEFFENLITKGLEESLNYELPVDASKYKPCDFKVRDYGSYDFVIIGGGTTGAVLANRLSEVKKFSVLVLEAGEFENNTILQIPRHSRTGYFSDFNWGFKSIPQKTACLGTINQQCMYVRGRGIGGTSLVNAVVYDRAAPETYNIYANLVKDASWSYRNVLKYFKKSEQFHWTNPNAPVDIQFHGKNGLFDIQHRVPDNRLNNIFLQAHRDLNISVTDYNGPNRLGGTTVQIYTRNGRRLDTGTAFIKPVLDRTNLKVLTGSYVTKIIFNDKKIAEKVMFTKNGRTYFVRANTEVLLSAGAVSSPQILMLSGIGPRKHLENLGIKVIENLQVGSNFIDHPGLRGFMFSSNYSAPNSTLKEQVQDFLNGTGVLTAATICQGLSFVQISEHNKELSDVEVICELSSSGALDFKAYGFTNKTYKDFWGSEKFGVSFSVRHLYPNSAGTIRLKSNDPFQYPLIHPNFYSDDENDDIDVIYRGIKYVFKLADTPAFKLINLKYSTGPLSACKGHEFKSKDYWYCFIRQVSISTGHPVGSCKMGTDRSKGAVLDSELKVYGVDRLRVVDASVFPKSIAGHTSAGCLMIGEKISDILKKTYGSD